MCLDNNKSHYYFNQMTAVLNTHDFPIPEQDSSVRADELNQFTC